MIVVAGVPRRGDKTWMGTHPTKRLFFRCFSLAWAALWSIGRFRGYAKCGGRRDRWIFAARGHSQGIWLVACNDGAVCRVGNDGVRNLRTRRFVRRHSRCRCKRAAICKPRQLDEQRADGTAASARATKRKRKPAQCWQTAHPGSLLRGRCYGQTRRKSVQYQ